MSDSNPTRARFAANKQAFEDILGDPFALDPIEGHYNLLKRRSSIAAVQNNFDEGHATANPARPNAMDFFCDVETVIKYGLTGSKEYNKKLLQELNDCYIIGDIEAAQLSQAERSSLEQRLGRLFRAYSISPVSKYFTTVRHGRPNRRNLNTRVEP